MKNSIIHLNVTPHTKARYVAASRAAGMKLTDYIQQAVEHYMQRQLVNFEIPDHITFDQLELAIDNDGHISFNTDVILSLCKTNNIDPRQFEESEDALSQLINNWYRSHIANGGDKHPVMENMIVEVMAEDAAGQTFSHSPGVNQ